MLQSRWTCQVDQSGGPRAMYSHSQELSGSISGYLGGLQHFTAKTVAASFWQFQPRAVITDWKCGLLQHQEEGFP